MEFIRKLLKIGNSSSKGGPDEARGVAPLQTQEEQDATRERMESEMADQKERRETSQSNQTEQ